MNKLKAFVDQKGLTVAAGMVSAELGKDISVQRLCNWVSRGVPWQFIYQLSAYLDSVPDELRNADVKHSEKNKNV